MLLYLALAARGWGAVLGERPPAGGGWSGLWPGFVRALGSVGLLPATGADAGGVAGGLPWPVVARLAASGPIDRGPVGRPVAALMFNVDWGEEHLPQILDTLARERARATFFVTGWWAERNAALVRRMAEEGHEVENHGQRHVHPAQLDEAAVRAHVAAGGEVIEKLTGRRPRAFAPAYGEFNRQVVDGAAAAGYVTVRWTSNTADYTRPPPAVIVNRAVEGAVNGGLVLMHPTAPTAEALPEIIRQFRARGLALTTVSDVLRLAQARQ